MKKNDYFKEVPFAVTICDEKGVLLEMNDKSSATFARHGGAELIGHSMLDCHPEHAQQKIRSMLENHNVNAYTIEKEGQKKLIYQSPWFENGEFKGLIELSLVLPDDMPHFVRK